MAQAASPLVMKLGGSGSKPLSSLPTMGSLPTMAINAEQDGAGTKKKKKSLKGSADNPRASVKKSLEASSLIAAVEQGGPSSSKDASGDNSILDTTERDLAASTNSIAIEATTDSKKSDKNKRSADQSARKSTAEVGAPLILTSLPTSSSPVKQKKHPDESQSALSCKATDTVVSTVGDLTADKAEETECLIKSEETANPVAESDAKDKAADQDEHLELEERAETEVDEGGTYTGQWRGTTRHGKGVLKKADGRTYEGCFVNGRVHGYGKFIAQNGTFEGQWVDDQAHGQGSYDHIDGSRYVGQWEHDKKSGEGVETWADGSHFKGQFFNGFKHGAGFYLSASGTSYEGQFANDKMDGHGNYKFPDGRAHIGQFREGHMNGSGSMKWPNGCKYAGSYLNDMKHGEGTFQWADGRAYHGQWQCGKQHGTGVLVKKDGQEIRAVWHEGKVTSSPEQMSQQYAVREHMKNARTSVASAASSSATKEKATSPGRSEHSDGSSDEGPQNARRASADLALIAAPKATPASRRQDDLMLLTGNRWSAAQSSQLQQKSGMASLLQAQAPCLTPDGSESEDDASQASNLSATTQETADIVFRPGPVNLTFLDGGIVKSALAGGQASGAGVQPGWKIIKVDGIPVRAFDKESINRLFVAVKARGQNYTVTFVKVGKNASKSNDPSSFPRQSQGEGQSNIDSQKAAFMEVAARLSAPKSDDEHKKPLIDKSVAGREAEEKAEQAERDRFLYASTSKVEPTVRTPENARVTEAKKSPSSIAEAVTEAAIEVTLELDSPRDPKSGSVRTGDGSTVASSPSKTSPGKKVAFAGEGKAGNNLLDAFQAAVDHVVNQNEPTESAQEDISTKNVQADNGSVGRTTATKEDSRKVSDDADFAAGGRRKSQEDKSLPPISLHEVQQWLLGVEIDPDVLRPLREDMVPTGSTFGCLPGKGRARSRIDIPHLSKDLVPDKDFTLYLSEAEVDFAEPTQWRMLKAVHGGLTRSKACPFTGPHWKALGFQSTDPRIDFRKTCGILNLVHFFLFFSHHSEILKNMYWLAVNNANNTQFPLATVSMKITRMVVHALLHGHATQFCNGCAVAEDHGVFQTTFRLYAAAFHRFYNIWQLPRKRDLEQALGDIAAALQKNTARLVSEFERALEQEEKLNSLQSLAELDAPQGDVSKTSPQRSAPGRSSAAAQSGLTKLVQKNPSRALE